ncbi:ABC transporter ATP-binding protein [Phytohabitans houttuyneae]|uniref:ABC transporter ATP-binding protein n=1 Tax=Phytohabitans houttuyneae TaxID=1076126 RepID=A0A6V8K807_9ACTN|nr:ATP-binding cassette domain-containing protein [Phytohabitans houttuyneae]GFJ76945.1 ABC transporter ATP-binding protein [Phytohabitans houttuyneae]
MDAVIEVDSLTKRFGRTVAVDGLSFAVPRGSIVGFLGPNGSGKTTTLRTLLGLTTPTAGRATVEGRPYAALPDPARVIGAVLDAAQFHPGRTGRDHLRVFARAAGVARSRVDALLRLVGLGEAAGRRVRGYSLGMRQRLSLATALLGDPRVLVLDEPANGLDPQGIRWLRDFLRDRRDEGRTVLVSSHVLSEVAQVVDEVLVLHKGRLVAQGPVAELTAAAGAPVRVRSADPGRLSEALAARGVTATGDGPGWLVAHRTTAESVGATAAEHRIAIYEMAAHPRTLEDIFLHVTGEADR